MSSEVKKGIGGISFSRKASPKAQGASDLTSRLKVVEKPEVDDEKLERLVSNGALGGYGVSRSGAAMSPSQEVAPMEGEGADRVIEQPTDQTPAAAQHTAQSLNLNAGAAPKARIRVQISRKMFSEVNSLRTNIPALNLTAISGVMWSLYKADMSVVFDEDLRLTGFDYGKYHKALAAGRRNEPQEILIFPATEADKRQLTALKKSVSGLLYGVVLERMWSLYKEEMKFQFEDGELVM